MKQKAWGIAIAVAVAAFFIIIALLSLFGGESAVSRPAPTERFFVNDYAEIIGDADEQEIYEIGAALQEKTGAQVVLLTVDNTGGESIEDYAIAIARDWGIGQEKQDNGVLLLFTTDGPHSRIEVGYGLEGALPDSKAGRILDTYLVPRYGDSERWSSALTATYKAITAVAYREYGVEAPESVTEESTFEEESEELSGGMIALILIFVVLCLIVRFSLLGRMGRGVFITTGFGGGGFGRGGFGGGGGFGGFSGGGGGFGGGGASR